MFDLPKALFSALPKSISAYFHQNLYDPPFQRGAQDFCLLNSCSWVRVNKIFIWISKIYLFLQKESLKVHMSSVHQCIPYLCFPSAPLKISNRICMAVIRYGIYVCRLVAASIPIITGDIHCLTVFLLEWTDLCPSSMLFHLLRDFLPYRAADRRGNGKKKTQTLSRQCGNPF